MAEIKKKLFVSWADYHGIVDEILAQVSESGFVPEVIVGIARGGLIPAVQLSNVLDTKFGILWLARCSSSKVFSLPEDKSIAVEGKILHHIPEKRVLLVDDIVDEGVTKDVALKILKEMGAAKVRFASLFINGKRHEKCFVDYCSQVTDGEWVVFPWEKRD